MSLLTISVVSIREGRAVESNPLSHSCFSPQTTIETCTVSVHMCQCLQHDKVKTPFSLNPQSTQAFFITFSCTNTAMVMSISLSSITKGTYITCYLSCMIVQVRVVCRKTVVGDWHFDHLSTSHSSKSSEESSSDDAIYKHMPWVIIWIGLDDQRYV